MISSLLLFHGTHQLHFHIILWKQSQVSLGWGSMLVEKSCEYVSHYLHSALLCRKELHCWGSWLSFDMDSKVARICLNIGLSCITTQTGVTTGKQTSADLRRRLNLKALLTFGSVAQQLLMSSAKLAGQPLGMVNLWETPRQGQAAGLK